MAEPSLRELKKLATARELAGAAFELARERDLDEVTIEDIVERVGFSRRTFANHFSRKQEAVVDGFFLAIGLPVGRFAAAEPPLAPTSADDALAGAEDYVTSLLVGRDLAVVQDFLRLVRAHRSLEPYLAQSLFELHSRMRTLLVDAGTDPHKAALLFGAVLGVTGVVVEDLVHPGGCSNPDDGSRLAGDASERPAHLAAADEAALRARLAEAFTYLRRGFSDEPTHPSSAH